MLLLAERLVNIKVVHVMPKSTEADDDGADDQLILMTAMEGGGGFQGAVSQQTKGCGVG